MSNPVTPFKGDTSKHLQILVGEGKHKDGVGFLLCNLCREEDRDRFSCRANQREMNTGRNDEHKALMQMWKVIYGSP